MNERQHNEMLRQLEAGAIIARNERRSMFVMTALCASATFSSIPFALTSDDSPFLVGLYATVSALGTIYATYLTTDASAELQKAQKELENFKKNSL